MGLDIYLHTAEEARQNAEYEKASEEWYGKDEDEGPSPYDRATEEERAAWRNSHDYAPHGNPPSEKYPDHLFNRRYLRSSYNGGGFNHAVPEMLGSSEGNYPNEYGSLSWIFEPVRLDDQYEIELTIGSIDGLRQAKARALEVAEKLRASDRIRVMTVSPNFLLPLPTHTDDDALRMYRAAAEQWKDREDGWWSNRDMEWYGSGVTILAAIPGLATFNVPGVHLIYRAGDEWFESYVQSAEIVAEFCDEAISLIERDGSCEMTWSG